MTPTPDAAAPWAPHTVVRSQGFAAAVEQCHAHMHPPACRSNVRATPPFAQTFEAMHFGLHQAAALVASPPFPDAAAQSVGGLERLVARQGCLLRLGVLARENHRLRLSCNDRGMARLVS